MGFFVVVVHVGGIMDDYEGVQMSLRGCSAKLDRDNQHIWLISSSVTRLLHSEMHPSLQFLRTQREWMLDIVKRSESTAVFIMREHTLQDFPTQASNNITETL